MRAVRWALALPLLLPACSLAYLTEHAGQADGGRDAPVDSGVDHGDGGGSADVDNVDAGWSLRAGAAMGFADLAGVWGSGPTDVWVVGYNQIVHWDGNTWSASPANVGPLSGVWGTSSSDVWAVGQGGAVFHY